MKRILAILAIVLTATFTGCNTMQGLGEDVEKAGEKIQKKAQ